MVGIVAKLLRSLRRAQRSVEYGLHLRAQEGAPIPGDGQMKNRSNNSNSGRANMGGNRQSHRTIQKAQRKQSRGEMRSEADVDTGIDANEAGRERRE